MKYAFFDGDKVGNSIKLLLLSNSLEEAKKLSENIKKAISTIERFLFQQEGIKVVIAGGDDILLEYDPALCSPKIIKAIPKIFEEETGLSMSFGVGSSIDESMDDLNFAKSKPFDQTTNQALLQTNSYSDYDDIALIIFSDSSFPDPYINVIAHWQARKKIKSIVLLNIERDAVKINSALKELEDLKKRIVQQIDLLSQSQYMRKIRGSIDEWEIVEIKISQSDRDLYKRLKENTPSLLFSEKVYPYSSDSGLNSDLNLDKQLSRLISDCRNSSVKPVFDISTVKKEFIVDLYAILSMEGIHSINTFQLVSEPTHSEKDLIHCLRFDSHYKYPCITNSDYTIDKTVTFRKSISNTQDFEDRSRFLHGEVERLETVKDNLKVQLSEGFASLWMTVIFFVLVLPTSLSVAWIAFRDWDNGFERYTFIVPVILLFLASFILQAVFRMNFSLNPQSIRKALKDWKLKRLSNY